MPHDIDAGIAALRGAVASGEFARLCRGHRVDLAVLFGSAVPRFDGVAGGVVPGDIDLAVRSTNPQARPDLVALATDLYAMTGEERFDLMLLDRAGTVARQRALTRGRKLFEAQRGLFAEAQIAAAMEYFDTAPLREMELHLLARA